MIKALDTFIPEARIGIEEIFQESCTQNRFPPVFGSIQEGVDFYRNTLKLNKVSFADGLTEWQMADNLMTRFLNTQCIDVTSINLLIIVVNEQYRTSEHGYIGHYLQYIYKLCNADVIHISGNHCANTEYAIILAETLLIAGQMQHILIVNVSLFRQHEERIVGTYGIHGDGAGIIYLNSDKCDSVHILGHHSYTNGSLYKANVYDPMASLLICKNYLFCLVSFVKKYGIRPTDVLAVMVQNANHLLISQCLQHIGFGQELLLLENNNKYGHLDSIDFIVNLKSIMEGPLPKGSKFFSFGTGWAGSNCCIYMQKN
ncbi:MAG: hypothetical protein DI539_24920 [Flavobacterium psychrophilum]|nr:MAG: hypothetical protein DI539_24920 [Flavobacterium psychrophilum]